MENLTKKIFPTLFLLSVSIFSFPEKSKAEIIFQYDYDSIQGTWNCSDPTLPGFTGKAACFSETYAGTTRHCGEISPGGRSGNSLKLWRRNGGQMGYCGYLNKSFTPDEFAKKHKELFIRFYMKIPPQWGADLASAASHKLNRMVTMKSYGGSVTSTIYFDIGGTSKFNTSKFRFNCTKVGGTYYTVKDIDSLRVNDGNWHSYELHFRMNSASGVPDGEFHLYINGNEVSLYRPYGPTFEKGLTGVDFGYSDDEYIATLFTPAIGNLTDGWWTFPTDDWHAIEFDDYVVSTEYIGPVSEQDETPPVAPGSLRVR